MTPKEALNSIKKVLARYLWEKTGVSEAKHFEYLQYDTEIEIVTNALSELEFLKKPPTAEEVIKALSEYLPFKSNYYYDREKRYFGNNDIIIICPMPKDALYISHMLPPHLITLIGRFYQSLEVK